VRGPTGDSVERNFFAVAVVPIDRNILRRAEPIVDLTGRTILDAHLGNNEMPPIVVRVTVIVVEALRINNLALRVDLNRRLIARVVPDLLRGNATAALLDRSRLAFRRWGHAHRRQYRLGALALCGQGK
jgi:hypothetical protein